MRRLFLLAIAVYFSGTLLPVCAAESDVQRVFRQISINARRHKVTNNSTKANRDYCDKSSTIEKNLVWQLNTAADLLKLMQLSKNKRQHLPGTEFQHEGQTDYLIYAECFAVRKLASFPATEAITSLEQARKIEHGNATVQEAITEVQSKLER